MEKSIREMSEQVAWPVVNTHGVGRGIWARLASGALIAAMASVGTLMATVEVVHAQGPYLPMSNPPANIAPTPNFSSSSSCWNGYTAVGQQSPACTALEMQAINNAQQQLGEPAITLPSNWQQLTNPERLFVFISLERISLGLPPYVGMDASLNAAAQRAAVQQGDPYPPANWASTYFADTWGSAWSGGWPGMGTLAADYGWLYNDGWGGSRAATSNYECTSATSKACWGHRDELLGKTDYSVPNGVTWGVGLNCATCVLGAGSAQGGASSTVLVAKPTVPDSRLHLTFTWAAELLATQTTVTAISPTSGSTAGGTTVTITGANFDTTAGATTVDFGSTPATEVSCASTTSCSAVSPPGWVGTVNVTATVGSTTTGLTAADRFTYVSDTASAYTALTPTRLLDTRTTGGALGPGGTRGLTVAGLDGVPAAATAVALNVTATDTTGTGYLSLYPAGSALPNVSNLNWGPGSTVANLVVVPVGSNGQVSIYNHVGRADVVVDLEGYFAPQTGGGAAGSYVPLTPARITDTRPGSGEPNAGKALGSGSTLDVQVTGQGGVPSSGVGAVVANVTATGTTATGYLTAYPAGASRPLASNLNWVAGQTVANRVVVPVGANGQIAIYNASGNANVVVDVTGYFTTGASAPAGASLYTPISPVRVLDTRQTGQALGPQATLGQQMAGVDGIPANATAVVTNVTAVNTTANSYLTVYPGGVRPAASDVNWGAGETVPNLTLASLGPSGAISLYNDSGTTNVVVDAFGYFSPS
ncbi:MAG: IPT/TIG domain-containing protein [Candidatus Dormibacteria bacterium]